MLQSISYSHNKNPIVNKSKCRHSNSNNSIHTTLAHSLILISLFVCPPHILQRALFISLFSCLSQTLCWLCCCTMHLNRIIYKSHAATPRRQMICAQQQSIRKKELIYKINKWRFVVRRAVRSLRFQLMVSLYISTIVSNAAALLFCRYSLFIPAMIFYSKNFLGKLLLELYKTKK